MARGRAGRPRGRGATHRSPAPTPPPTRRPYTRRVPVEKRADKESEEETLTGGRQAQGHSRSPAEAAAAQGLRPASTHVWVVPRGRMLTRGLLRGTSPVVEGEGSSVFPGDGLAPRGRVRGRHRSTGGGRSPSQEATTTSSTSAGVSTDLSSHRPTSPAGTLQVGGLLRCVCNQYFTSNKDVLLECTRCHNWSHPSCWGMDYNEVWRYKRERTYVCAYCRATAVAEGAPPPWSGSGTLTTPPSLVSPTEAYAGAPDGGSSSSPTTVATPSFTEMHMNAYDRRQKAPPPLKLREVPDLPAGAQRQARQVYVELMEAVLRVAARGGYEVVFFGPENGLLTAAQLRAWNGALRGEAKEEEERRDVVFYERSLSPAWMEACYRCCAPSIAAATFSPDYPYYCLQMVSAGHHPYLQGTLLRPRRPRAGKDRDERAGEHVEDGDVCAFELSNGMDFYCNLKSTVTQLKMAHSRGEMHLPPTAAHDPLHTYRTVHLPYLLRDMADTSDFVHVTLSATHPRYQQRGLAKLLLTLDLLRWLWRGRTRAVLNMAIEKKLVYPSRHTTQRRKRNKTEEEDEDEEAPVLMYTPSPASRHLYTYFHFFDVYPKVDAQTKEEVWTAKESEHGRVMVNYQMQDRVCAVAAGYQQGTLSVGSADATAPSPPSVVSRRERRGADTAAATSAATLSLVAAVNRRRPYKKRQTQAPTQPQASPSSSSPSQRK